MFDVFAERAGGGNPCPVIPAGDDLGDEQMQQIAAATGHETVFLLTPTVPDARIRMRYFVPRHEMEMCVHATIAALTHLAVQGGRPIHITCIAVRQHDVAVNGYTQRPAGRLA
jgi:trans-2,3-dihydro-3-hydroxyanthranilate isomerase